VIKRSTFQAASKNVNTAARIIILTLSASLDHAIAGYVKPGRTTKDTAGTETTDKTTAETTIVVTAEGMMEETIPGTIDPHTTGVTIVIAGMKEGMIVTLVQPKLKTGHASLLDNLPQFVEFTAKSSRFWITTVKKIKIIK